MDQPAGASALFEPQPVRRAQPNYNYSLLGEKLDLLEPRLIEEILNKFKQKSNTYKLVYENLLYKLTGSRVIEPTLEQQKEILRQILNNTLSDFQEYRNHIARIIDITVQRTQASQWANRQNMGVNGGFTRKNRKTQNRNQNRNQKRKQQKQHKKNRRQTKRNGKSRK